MFSMRAAVMLVFSLAANAGAAFGTTVTLAESHIVVQHRSVSTHDQAAQRLFDEGLTLVYAFNRNEATVRFQKAAAIDPRLAMAWRASRLPKARISISRWNPPASALR